jgi:L-threonylcarbamoyladenylate synthase
MKIVRADAEGESLTAEWLLQGGVAVVPTDTVYGLAARPAEVAAVRTIYRLKGRPEGLHLPVLAATADQVRSLGVAFTPAAEALARRWWPGPLTLAFGFDPQRERPDWLQGRTEVAVRIPAHAFLRAVLQRTGVLVVTSANPHGAPTPRTAKEVAGALGSAVELLVDGGELQDVPSTLVNVNGGTPSIEREGAIARQAITETMQEAL